MLPKALKTCPKSDKSPNLVTLAIAQVIVTLELKFANIVSEIGKDPTKCKQIF